MPDRAFRPRASVAIVPIPNVVRSGQVVFCRCHRTRGGDSSWQAARSGRTSCIPPRPRSPAIRGSRSPQTSATDAPTGRPQRFVEGRDIPQEWWALFKSPALNALVERALQQQSRSAVGLGHVARGARKRSRPRRASISPWSRPISIRRASAPRPRSRRSRLPAPTSSDLVYRAGSGVLHIRRLGPQPARGRSAAGAGRHAALPGRGGLPDAHLEYRRSPRSPKPRCAGRSRPPTSSSPSTARCSTPSARS